MKVEKDKYNANKQFSRWFFRDFLRKVFVLGLDAKRECKGYRIANSAGLSTPELCSWGITLSPLNNVAAFLMVEHKKDVTPGAIYFHSLLEEEKIEFLIRLASEAVALAKNGYVHRDFHLNNFLIDGNGRILWIDTHFRKLSKLKGKKWQQLVGSLSDDKLEGEKYKNVILSIFKENFCMNY